ncbi:hypothetical protein A6R68_23557, partial [Neotoma lepida]
SVSTHDIHQAEALQPLSGLFSPGDPHSFLLILPCPSPRAGSFTCEQEALQRMFLVLHTWTNLVKLAPWLPDSNLFNWDMWDRVETLTHRAQIEKEEIPRLGAIPTVTGLMACFPSRPSKPKGPPSSGERQERLNETKNIQSPPKGDKKPPNQVTQGLTNPPNSLYPSLDPFDVAPWPSGDLLPHPSKSLPGLPSTNPFLPPLPPLPYPAEGPPRETMPSLFPVNVKPGGNRPLAWYPWEAQDIKDVRKAVSEARPNSPWAETIILGLAYQALTTQDWRNLAKAVLSGFLYLKWNACFQEECCLQVERNQAANPQIPITFGMLAGTSDQYSIDLQQATLPAPYQDQVQVLGTAAWKKLEEGPTEAPCLVSPKRLMRT